MSAFTHLGAGTPAQAWAERAAAEEPARLDLRPYGRVVVLAAHPDDETLGAAGLIATAVAAGCDVEVIVASLGEASHPDSPTHSPRELARVREAELHAAAECLGVEPAHVSVLGMPDGGIAAREEELVHAVVERLGEAAGTLLAAPYSHDGHPDHEAVGRAGRVAALRCDAELVEYPIWLYHAQAPDALHWADVRALPLGAQARAAKRAALAAHASQVAPLSDAPGDEAILQPGMLAHFDRDTEWFVAVPRGELRDDALDALHRRRPEPWGAHERWYEERKRAITVAMLPQRRYERALEVGSSTGWLAAALAERAAAVLALDASPAAIAAARAHVPDTVELERARVPEEWPAGTFDLVVVSETAYFLSPAQNARLLERIRGSLAPAATVVYCHWQHPIAGWPLSPAAIHHRFAAAGLLDEFARYRDRDVEILVRASPAHRPDPER
ncbi:PIG-L family deacetylase [Brevibacterium sp. BRM-1]|uniref:PIG-L deacetylase family protein n=1 Tax=Brevibacterium sp. BRM-1 TaxID=2999062 RepID=UPI00228298AB|nr:PIG-L family deacetylase [Brevibacterium sp. BRM-1]WAL40564.1 PIG-L family deacetylase [Brevibacterium sp. BRM-1]